MGTQIFWDSVIQGDFSDSYHIIYLLGLTLLFLFFHNTVIPGT